jgi:zinc/manganese transport system substrate-binding protein
MTLARSLLLAATFAASLVPSAIAAEKLKVVASFSILGDMTGRIGGELIDLKTIVGANGDAHVYEPTPADAKSVADAGLVVVNGLGFEGWLDRLVSASGYRGPMVVAAAGIKPAAMEDEHREGEEPGHEEHGRGDSDPHAWQNAVNAAVYAENIAKALCDADTANCPAYKANAAKYLEEISALDAAIESAVSRVPEDRRTVIMSHDAFGYFERAYGVTILAPEGVSTDSEASARDVAALISQIREKKASALFVENIADPRLIEQISRETGLKIGGELFSDALSEADGPAPTYLKMMEHNIRLLSDAMAGT